MMYKILNIFIYISIIVMIVLSVLFFSSSHKRFFDFKTLDSNTHIVGNNNFNFKLNLKLNCNLEDDIVESVFLKYFIKSDIKWQGEYVCENKHIRQTIKISKSQFDFFESVDKIKHDDIYEIVSLKEKNILYYQKDINVLFFMAYGDNNYVFFTNLYIEEGDSRDYVLVE